MSEFISSEEYRQFEMYHAGWSSAVTLAACLVGQLCKASRRRRIIEFGSGPGTSTPCLIEKLREIWGESTFRIDCVDVDPVSAECLQRVLGNRPDSEARVILADGVEFCPGYSYDALVAIFSVSHLSNTTKVRLIERLPQLVSGGFAIIVDEFLPLAGSSLEAHWLHHGAVIFDALIKGHFELAIIELEALHSGLHGIGDFKVSNCCFERLLENSGLSWTRIRTFPVRGDLLPDCKGHGPMDTKAQAIWNSLALNILDELLPSPSRSSLFPSRKARSALRSLYERLQALDLSSLRKNRPFGTLQKNIYRVEYPGVLQNGNSWGVYVYAVSVSESHERIRLELQNAIC